MHDACLTKCIFDARGGSKHACGLIAVRGVCVSIPILQTNSWIGSQDRRFMHDEAKFISIGLFLTVLFWNSERMSLSSFILSQTSSQYYAPQPSVETISRSTQTSLTLVIFWTTELLIRSLSGTVWREVISESCIHIARHGRKEKNGGVYIAFFNPVANKQ